VRILIKRLSISGLFFVSFGFSVFYSSALLADPSDTSAEEQSIQKMEELPVIVPAQMTDDGEVEDAKTSTETMTKTEQLPVVVPAQMVEQEAPLKTQAKTEDKPEETPIVEQTTETKEIAAPTDAMASKCHFSLTLTETPKYTSKSTHFDYVNPHAPKGGEMRLQATGSFDSLNPFSIKGISGAGVRLIYDQLMQESIDEGSIQYCHLCEWVSYPSDYSSVTFKLRQGPAFHDGKPITAEDVMFSMTELKKAHPSYGQYYKNVTRSEITGPNEVTFYFDKKNNRELPFIVGQLYVLPKHFWTGKNAKGELRDLSKKSLEIPLGSGPYKVGKIGRASCRERV